MPVQGTAKLGRFGAHSYSAGTCHEKDPRTAAKFKMRDPLKAGLVARVKLAKIPVDQFMQSWRGAAASVPHIRLLIHFFWGAGTARTLAIGARGAPSAVSVRLLFWVSFGVPEVAGCRLSGGDIRPTNEIIGGQSHLYGDGLAAVQLDRPAAWVLALAVAVPLQ